MQNIPSPNQQKQLSVPQTSDVEAIGNELYDGECLKLINEYFYGVRIFPGQDPTHVYVGWVTTQYHLHSKDFNQSQVRKSAVVIVDDYERIIDGYVIIVSIAFCVMTRISVWNANHVIWYAPMSYTTK